MWVIERRIEEIYSQNQQNHCKITWDVKRENDLFYLQERKQKTSPTKHHMCDKQQVGVGLCLLCSQSHYRIIVRNTKAIVIAKSDDLKEISEKWNELEHFVPMFSSYYYEECRKQQLVPKKKLILENQNVIELIFTKLSAMVREESNLIANGELIDDAKIRDEFKSFEAFGIAEPLCYYCTCSLWCEKYIPGVIFLTQNFLCFGGLCDNFKIHFPLTTLYDFEKASCYPFFHNAIRFHFSFRTYALVDLENEQQTYNMILPIWQNAMKQYLQKLKSLNQPIEEEVKSISRRNSDISDSYAVSRTGSFSCNSILTSQSFTFENGIIPLFSNPSKEILFMHESALFFKKLIVGVVMVSDDLLAFRSTEKDMSIIIPISEIVKTKQLKTIDTTWKISASIRVQHIRNPFLFYFNDWELMAFLFQRKQTTQSWRFNLPKYRLNDHSAEWSEKQSFFVQAFSLSEKKDDFEKSKKWDQYFNIYGLGVTMVRTEQLRQLILHGIPHNRRESMWRVLSHTWYKRKPNQTYEYYLERSKKEYEFETLLEIEKDLKRSMPEHPYFRKRQSLAALRRILVAFATRNKDIGYCQGMNYIASLLMLFMDEEEAFLLLTTICEEIIPDYYTTSMIGSMIDLEVFANLMEKYLPEVHNHITNTIGPVQLITIPWFMILFISILPWELTFRLFDMLLSEGSRALFVFSLSLFHVFQKEVMQIKHCDGINDLKDAIYSSTDTKLFLKSVYHFEALVTHKEIQTLRNELTPNILRDLGTLKSRSSTNNPTITSSSSSSSSSSDDEDEEEEEYDFEAESTFAPLRTNVDVPILASSLVSGSYIDALADAHHNVMSDDDNHHHDLDLITISDDHRGNEHHGDDVGSDHHHHQSRTEVAGCDTNSRSPRVMRRMNGGDNNNGNCNEKEEGNEDRIDHEIRKILSSRRDIGEDGDVDEHFDMYELYNSKYDADDDDDPPSQQFSSSYSSYENLAMFDDKNEDGDFENRSRSYNQDDRRDAKKKTRFASSSNSSNNNNSERKRKRRNGDDSNDNGTTSSTTKSAHSIRKNGNFTLTNSNVVQTKFATNTVTSFLSFIKFRSKNANSNNNTSTNNNSNSSPQSLGGRTPTRAHKSFSSDNTYIAPLNII